MVDEVQARLAVLAGSWRGSGVGDYPTIDRFEYDETLRFELDPGRSLIHYEQRARLKNGEPSHWESGFLRWLEDGTIELSSAQNGGRVEVLQGLLVDAADPAGLRLELDSILLGHDPRPVRTRRVIEVHGHRLSYVMGMATTTTPTPDFQQHLEAVLQRAGP